MTSTIATSVPSSRIKVLTLGDVDKAAATLYKLFAADSLAQLLTHHIADPVHRRKVDYLVYQCYLRQHIAKGLCLGIGESEHEFETVAIWALPTSEADGLDSFANLMLAGYGQLWEHAGAEGRHKIFLGMLPLLHDTAARILATDARFKGTGVFTLVYLGSVELARGKGNVRAIFDYMFQNHIDVPNSNHIAYLESSSPANIPIYARFGFHFYEDIMLGSRDKPDAKEGEDYAIMKVMIRGPYGKSWLDPKL